MSSKIYKAINNPVHALQILYALQRRYLKRLLTKKVFSHTAEHRSVSENGEYAAVVTNALRTQKSFDNFKRNTQYQEILEHVSKDQGSEYLAIILSRNDGLMNDPATQRVLQLDEVGNPIKYQYEGYDCPLSPTTLRYIKVASDVHGLFGKGIERVAEIGCGYGGQTLVNDQLLDYKHATLFDLPFVNELIRRYLNSMLLKGFYKVTTVNESQAETYDLVISNYAFSELPSPLQKAYIHKVLSQSQRGYLTMNSGIGGGFNEGKLSLDELRNLLPPFEVFEEEPLTSDCNYILVWGHNKDFASSNLKVKKA